VVMRSSRRLSDAPRAGFRLALPCTSKRCKLCSLCPFQPRVYQGACALCPSHPPWPGLPLPCALCRFRGCSSDDGIVVEMDIFSSGSEDTGRPIISGQPCQQCAACVATFGADARANAEVRLPL